MEEDIYAAVTDAADNFIKAVKGLGAYGAYSGALKAISSDAKLRARLADFKELNRARILASAAGREPDENEDKRASNLYWQLALDNNAAAFLESERELATVLREAFLRAIKEIGLETEFYI